MEFRNTFYLFYHLFHNDNEFYHLSTRVIFECGQTEKERKRFLANIKTAVLDEDQFHK